MNQTIEQRLQRLIQQQKALNALYRHAAIQYEISKSEFWMLYAFLVLEGEYSQQDICELWSLPKQTVNSVTAGLVKKGYVVLEQMPGTHNQKKIGLTNAGKSFGEKTVMNIYLAELKDWRGCRNRNRKRISPCMRNT